MNMSLFWRDMLFALSMMGLFLTIHMVNIQPVKPAVATVQIELPLPPQTEVPPVFTEREIQCVRNVVYGEARGESVEAQIAVAATVINRSFSTKWSARDLCKIAKKKDQYKGYQAVIRLQNELEVDAWDRALQVAIYTAMNHNTLPDEVQSALYFHSGEPSSWHARFRVVAKIGGLIFYA